ncbi:MAG: hypothetical protein U0165_06010 [Polyangiaceae bacterium]
MSYRVDLAGVGTSGAAASCATARFDGLLQGVYTASVTATSSLGTSELIGVCKGYDEWLDDHRYL